MRALLGLGLLLMVVGCPAPEPEVPPPPTYTVVSGDSLSRIASRHGTTAQQLRDWNGIEGDLIVPGQVLVVGDPGGEAVAAAARKPKRTTKTTSRRPRAKAPPGEQPNEAWLYEDEEPTQWPALRMPSAKPCLAEDAGIEDGSFGRSQGLEPEQISPVVSAFQQQTLRCYTEGVTAGGPMELVLEIGCDGRVRRSTVRSDGTGDGAFAACVADAFRYAGFPAHARDLVEVVIPLRFTAP
ncbi:MAG: LysM peptidoglycan-binding domain-containing protein [Proteobacteria bacterium]|nr:LysM peptidoglycan-binding domain-containing protein [Pseudomonadota bacterium]